MTFEQKPNYSKLIGRAIEKLGSQKRLAQAMGLSESGLSHKMQAKNAFTQHDIIIMCKLLQIERKEIPDYFFSFQVK